MTLKEYNTILKQTFGYQSLKEDQYKIIDMLINQKRDICAVLATGFGKSLCFQMPHLITGQSVIVVSPLIALMDDQKTQMEKLGIPVCVLNGTNTSKARDKRDILNGENKIIYITPEYIQYCAEFIIGLAEADGLCAICIDESHCASVYSDFRPAYSKLGVLKEWVPEIPILALTATASKKVRSDICDILQLTDPELVIGDFDRPNLMLNIKHKTDIATDLLPLLDKYIGEYVIIYCKTRDDTEKMALALTGNGYPTLVYHAGLSTDTRSDVQQKYLSGEYKIISATIAYGLGINIPGIRLIIHYGCPKNIEGYYQEVGRAGRDGMPAECHLFYSSKDFSLSRFFLRDIANPDQRLYQEEQINIIQKFVNSHDCRRIVLLGSFDDQYNKTRCDNCDNCISQKKVTLCDYTYATYLIVSMVNSLNGKCGVTFVVNALRGSNAKTMTFVKKNPLYGKGIIYTDKWLKAVGRMLVNADYLKEVTAQGQFGCTISCTVKSLQWLKKINMVYKKITETTVFNNPDKILLQPSDEMGNVKTGRKKAPVVDLADTDDIIAPEDIAGLVEPVRPPIKVTRVKKTVIIKKKVPIEPDSDSDSDDN